MVSRDTPAYVMELDPTGYYDEILERWVSYEECELTAHELALLDSLSVKIED